MDTHQDEEEHMAASAGWAGYTEADSDTELLRRLRRSDSAAFEELFLRHYGQVYRVLYGLVGERQAAEDLLQETFLTLYRHPPQPETGMQLRAWLCRVALNRGYNALRSERRAQATLQRSAIAEEPVDPDAEVLRRDEQARVQVAIAHLPERQGKLLLLRYAGFSYAEIAVVLEIRASSVGTLLARAERAFVTAYERGPDSETEASLAKRTI
jgi:RNA polymerase sigma-70 factor (ECF subfamily)